MSPTPGASPVGSVVVRFSLTGAEYAAGMRVIMRRQPSLWIGPGLGAVTLVAGVILGAPLVLFSGLMLSGFAVWSFYAAPAMTWRRTPRLQLEQVHTFSGTGISVRAGTERGQLPWGFYRQATETSRVYVFLRTSRQGNFVPKAAFASPEDETRFRALVAAHLTTSWGG